MYSVTDPLFLREKKVTFSLIPVFGLTNDTPGSSDVPILWCSPYQLKTYLILIFKVCSLRLQARSICLPTTIKQQDVSLKLANVGLHAMNSCLQTEWNKTGSRF